MMVLSFAEELMSLGTVEGLWIAGEGITTDTGVSSWADQSGNGRHLANSSGGAQPSLESDGPGGLSYLAFDGTDDILYASFAINAPIDLFCGLKPSASDAGVGFSVVPMTISGANGGAWPHDPGTGGASPNQMRVFGGQGSVIVGSVPADDWHIVSSHLEDDATTLTVDGESTTGDAGPGWVNTINRGLTLGGFASNWPSSLGAFMDCHVGDVVIYSSISAGNAVRVRALLAARWTP